MKENYLKYLYLKNQNHSPHKQNPCLACITAIITDKTPIRVIFFLKIVFLFAFLINFISYVYAKISCDLLKSIF